MNKRAFLVVGAESSGTRYMAKVLVTCGCEGSDQHEQPFDHSLDGAGKLIVWRRSLPHAGDWPNLQHMIQTLRQRDYDVAAVVTVRDTEAIVASQLRAPHTSSREQSLQNIQSAYTKIFSALAETKLPYELAIYEAMASDAAVLPAMLRRLGLNAAELPPFVDGNAKYRRPS